MKDFYNDGFGWTCKHCEREVKAVQEDEPQTSRLMREGEAESKNPRLANRAQAKWADAAQTTLVCPRCGITERVEKA